MGLSTQSPLFPVPESLTDPAARAALEVFTMWNDVSPAAIDTERLHEISVTHGVPEVALAAELLLELEVVRNGFLPRRDLTLVDLTSRIANSTMHAIVELRDVIATVVLAEGLIVFHLGQHDRLGQQLREIISRMPAPHRHIIWANHLLASAEALACSDVPRALLEWSLFEQRVQRFLPARLQHTIAAIGTRLRHPEAEITDPNNVHDIVISYFTGHFHRVQSPVQQQPPAPLGRKTPGASNSSPEIPLLALAQRHMKADADENPVELLRVAETLAEREFWGPAITAVDKAHEIFTRRRASANIARCDEIRAQVITSASERFPWFAAPPAAAQQRSTLTPRELNAAQLAAQGMSNKDIATQMLCSVRTAESHVARARAKLGARNRGDLAARLPEQP